MPTCGALPCLHDLIGQLDIPAVRDLLGLSVFPDPVRLAQICERYREGPPRYLLGCQRNGVVTGCIGLRLLGEGQAVVENLAVLPARQKQGIGRKLLRDAAARFGLSQLELETDREAVEFYRRCGFTVTSLGEKYPGTERFRCTWRAATP